MRKVMAALRLSRLQKHILRWLLQDYRRTNGSTSSSHQELVRALPGDKGNISRSLQTLEAQGLIAIGRTPGGKAEYLLLTSAGHKRTSQIELSCD
jgi:DNA-binding MarR family transcriptional regulator